MSSFPRLTGRRLTAAAALGVVTVLACAGPASAGTPADAATWLSTTALTDGNHIVVGGFDQDGASADAVSALVAAGGHADAVTRLDAYLKTAVDDYTDPTGANGYGPSSGGLAKLAIAAEATGQDPHAYGGFDLLTYITDNQCQTASADANCTAPGQFANIYSSISQSLGVIALQRSPIAADHQTVASPAVVRLLAERCTDGLFTGSLLAPGTTCATGSVDETAYAVQALAAVSGADDPLVTATLTALAGKQDASGGFTGAAGINANSTGVALSAFSLQPVTFAAAVTQGRAFLGSVQRTDGGYLATAADRTKTEPEQLDSAKLATPQALLGVVGANLAGIVVAAPPVTTPPASGTPTAPAPTSGSTGLAAGTAPELANTGASDGHLTTELLLAAVAIAGGGALLRFGASRLPLARHRG